MRSLCHCGRSKAKTRNPLIINARFSGDCGLILNQVQDAMTDFSDNLFFY